MSLLFRRFLEINVQHIKTNRNNVQILFISSRKLSILPSVYDGEQDPAPKFFSSPIQTLLKRLTRPDFAKVFRKRTNRGYDVLKTPRYKFLTNEELEKEIARAQHRANKLLQMPPVIKVYKPVENVLSRDPALIGYDKSKYLFTDISFGVTNEHRLIVERDIDGTLRGCDYNTRKRLNQAYFPIVGRKIKEPIMFTDEERLHKLLDRNEYEFVLDRACLQYEPDEQSYQRTTSITYQHLDMKNKYEILRSTRHFGPLVFYLTWHQTIDGLMLELLQNGAIREAVCLIAVRHGIHSDIADGNQAQNISEEVLKTPIQLSKPETLSEEDIQLDNKCFDCVEKYITSNSSMKNQQELALQGFREIYQELVELSRGLKKAHGTN